MAAGNCFDQWRKDVFFAAAEEVQESADKMESVYRLWTRLRGEGLNPEIWDELGSELHTALGIAKWQLEEFERAVNLNHENCLSEDSTIARHRQFVEALRNQNLTIEKALHDSYVKEGKKPLQWVHLDNDERDDLAIFLSAAPNGLKQPINKYANGVVDSAQAGVLPGCINGFKETLNINKDAKYTVELEAKNIPKTKNEVCGQGEKINAQGRTWSSPDIGALKIVITDEDDKKNKVIETRTEVSCLCGFLKNSVFTERSKWLKNSFRKVKNQEHLQLRGGISSYLHLKRFTSFARGTNVLGERNKSCLTNCRGDSTVSHENFLERVGVFQKQAHGSRYYMQFNQSFRLTILLMLTIFLIVPFVLYST